MTLTDSTRLRIIVALAFFAAMVAFIAILGEPPLKTWAAYGVVLAMLIAGIAAFVGGARDVIARAPRLAILFVLNAMLLQFCLALILSKGGFSDPDYRFTIGLRDIGLYAGHAALAFLVAFAYGIALDFARKALGRWAPGWNAE